MTPLLEVRNLRKYFPGKRGLTGRAIEHVHAVEDVSFDLMQGETLGLVGESGSGKSTVGRLVMRLLDPDAGRVVLGGTDLTALSGRELRQERPRFQMVFQDPYASLDPSMVVADTVGEALEVNGGLRGKARDARVLELFERVGLGRQHLQRYPYEFSGGQRQRIAIARALAVHPSVIVCDEAVSALDVSTQSQVINLLDDLQQELGMSYLFIAHDLAVVRHISARIAVMYLGSIVEIGPAEEIYGAPRHPYTEALLSAIPIPNPTAQRRRQRIVLRGDVPNPAHPPSGCRFHTRCPYVMDMCREVVPELLETEAGVLAACHLHTHGPKLDGQSLVHVQPTGRNVDAAASNPL